MTIEETISYTLPSHWLPALINGDLTGLEDEELNVLEHFCAQEIGGIKRNDRLELMCWEPKGDEVCFSHHTMTGCPMGPWRGIAWRCGHTFRRLGEHTERGPLAPFGIKQTSTFQRS